MAQFHPCCSSLTSLKLQQGWLGPDSFKRKKKNKDLMNDPSWKSSVEEGVLSIAQSRCCVIFDKIPNGNLPVKWGRTLPEGDRQQDTCLKTHFCDALTHGGKGWFMKWLKAPWRGRAGWRRDLLGAFQRWFPSFPTHKHNFGEAKTCLKWSGGNLPWAGF